MLHLGHHRILHQGEKSWRGSSATSTATTDWRPGYNAGYSRLQPRLQWLPSSATSDCPWCPVPPALPWSSTALPCLKRLTSTQMLSDFLFCAIICQTVIYFHRGQLCIILQTPDFRRPQVRELSKKNKGDWTFHQNRYREIASFNQIEVFHKFYFIVLPVLILWLMMTFIAKTNNKFSNFCRSGTHTLKLGHHVITKKKNML